MKTAALHNLGCKVNSYETDAMREILERAGYAIVPFEEEADVYIINTCSVTNIADRKSRQMLHRAKKRNPQAVVIAAGCYAQAAGTDLLKDGAVDLVIGNNEKAALPEILQVWEEGHEGSRLHDLTHEKRYENLQVSRTSEHTRAYVKIEDGCDQFCSYCIIPYVRGRVRSRELTDIAAEIKRLADNGYREIVLTGIHLDSYGSDLGDTDLLTVIEAAAKIDGIERIRLGSLEPRIMTEEFVRGLAAVDKLCPHFHLSLQSGCDETLRRMNRKYDARQFRECCERLRRYFDDPALTTDVIVGFPGETDEEFEQTVRFLKEIRFYETHVFKYSRRKGTRADRMEPQVPESIKNERSDVLLALTKENSEAYRRRRIGSTAEMLIEEAWEHGGETYQVGHTREYIKVGMPDRTSLANQIMRVRLGGLLDREILLGVPEDDIKK